MPYRALDERSALVNNDMSLYCADVYSCSDGAGEKDPMLRAGGDEPAVKDKWRVLLESQWPLLTVIITGLMALANPAIGAKGGILKYELVIPTVIVSVFFIIGLTVPMESLKAGTKAFKFHALCQTVSLVLVPGIYYITIYRWGFDRWLLTEDFSKGVMCALCMPAPCFTCVMFTAQAGGCEAVAVFNAALGNILGPVVSPFTARLALGAGPGQEVHDQVVKLLLQLFAPLVAGAAMQHAVELAKPEWCESLRKRSKSAFNVLLFIALYYIFCEGFHTPSHDITAGTITVMCAWVLVLYLLMFAMCWGIGCILPPQRRVALAIVASQKTEGMAVAILAIISPHSGVLTLPVVAYHSVQMAVAALICPEIFKWVRKQEDYDAEDEEDVIQSLSPRSPWTSSVPNQSIASLRGSLMLGKLSARSHGSHMDLAD